VIVFEWIIGILLGAVLLSSLAKRIGAPYPALLALGGAVLAFTPGAPRIALEPELALALFLAPVLLDAAYDTSPRDLKDNWLPVTCLVLVAVGLTTAAVAIVGGRYRARGHRCPTRCRCGNGGAPASALAAPHPDNSGRREPAQ
jgi:CPA1 family monovalent cation:H+ antiporter